MQAWQELSIDMLIDKNDYVVAAEIASQTCGAIICFPDYTFAWYGTHEYLHMCECLHYTQQRS